MSDNKEELATETRTAGSLTLGKTGILMTTLAFTLCVGAFGYGYFQLSKVNVSLARMVAELRQAQESNQQEIQQLKQLLTNNTAQAVPTAVTTTQPADTSRESVMEAQSLVKLAATQLTLLGDGAGAFVSLRHAQDILQNIQSAALDQIRQNIAENISVLNNTQQASPDQIASRLGALSSQLDKLPLPPTPLQYTQDANTKPRDFTGMPWWKIQWHKSMDALRKIVIVRYNGANEMPLIMPEEKIFLYQNLHAQLDIVMLGLLNHHSNVYYSGLDRMGEWVEKYFVQDDAVTKDVLAQINALKNEKIVPPPVDIAATRQAFEQYLVQNASTQQAVH